MEIPPEARAWMNRSCPPEVAVVRAFLHSYVEYCDGFDEVRANLIRFAQLDPESLRRAVTAIERLVTIPTPEYTLPWLVEDAGNRVLDDFSDAAATVWLADLAAITRDILAAHDG